MSCQARWVELDEVDSTQKFLTQAVKAGDMLDVVFAHDQTSGRGRFDRQWHSRRGESLTLSVSFTQCADHPHPWILGMFAAMVAAEQIETGLQWPNDLVHEGKKVGGVLTETIQNPCGETLAVVGIGLNLNNMKFSPELEGRATSAFLAKRLRYDPLTEARLLVANLFEGPIPVSWPDIVARWMARDQTPGKTYVLPNGDRALARRIGPQGELVALVDEREVTVLVADAIFGENLAPGFASS